MILNFRSSFPALVAFLVFSLGSAGSALAACYATDQQLPGQTVNDFLSNSGQLLQDPKNANGGADMISLVRDLVASNSATLPMIIALLKNANAGQQTAIGTGLGQAAGLCIRSDPAVAGDIQTQLAGTTSDVAKNAYAAVTGNQPIRSVAGGGGVSGGSSGGSTGGSISSVSGGSSLATFSSNSTLNGSSNFFTGGTTGATSGGGTTNNTIGPAVAVSP